MPCIPKQKSTSSEGTLTELLTFTMSDIQFKNYQACKKQRHMTNNNKKHHLTGTDPELTQMKEFMDKDNKLLLQIYSLRSRGTLKEEIG